MSADREIWGVTVGTTLSGRTNWPNEIKVMAVAKVLDDGVRVAEIGHEIGAHENLIRKWCNQERRARGEMVDPQQAFASVTVNSASAEISNSSQMCKLHLGDAILEFPGDIPAGNLQAMVNALRCSQ